MTTMRFHSAAPLALLLLVGCSSKGGDGNSGAAAGGSAGGTQASAPDNEAADAGNIAVPVTVPSPTALGGIPAAFSGRWASVANECDPANASIAKGLMVVAGDRLSFYESRGTAAHVRQLAPGSIGFDLPISGEGMKWSETTRLTLQDGGRTLVRQVSAPADRKGGSIYQRCPA